MDRLKHRLVDDYLEKLWGDLEVHHYGPQFWEVRHEELVGNGRTFSEAVYNLSLKDQSIKEEPDGS